MNLPTAAPLAGLVWFVEHDMGYYPVIEGHNGDSVYNQAYYDNYAKMGDTDLGKRITWARLALVDRFLRHGSVIDVGIGAGAFVEARNKGAPTYGWDINPVAIEWLTRKELLKNPETPHPPSALSPDARKGRGLTFWDVLEHIEEPDAMLSNVEWVFCSLPLFDGPQHVLRSKHFKVREHCWYFTRNGLINWMGQRNFVCREHNTMESLLGREDIHSFAFQRLEATG